MANALNTITLPTINTITRTAIVVQGQFCSVVWVQEDGSVANYPTTDLLISATLNGTQRRIPLGSSYPFRKDYGVYSNGDIVGYVQAVKGSTTLSQDESGL